MMLFLGTALFPQDLAVAASRDGSPVLQDHIVHKKRFGDLNAMVKQQEIRALVAYSKTYYFLDKGTQRGISYELLREFEKYINRKFGTQALKIKVVITPVRRDELIQRLVEGYGDIAVANLTITPERLKQVDFSIPFLRDVKEVVVTSADEKSFASFDDLEGREVYVRRSSSYYESLLVMNNLFRKTGRKPMKLIEADESFEDEDLMEMVNAGLISTIIVDSHKAKFWAKVFANIRVHPKAYVRSEGDIAWAFRKKSPELAAVVNEFLEKHRKGTLVGNLLFNRYLKNTHYVKDAISKMEMEKFDRMVSIFEKYAAKYDFDYLLLGAQAYQESGLDQKKKSPAGAIGVMQVLPSTARDPNVNISDIHLLEENIHAGTKYLRYIANRYFNDGSIDPLNRMLFAFAAYNAGPARIQRVRRKAGKMGLDPNVWFQNTEIAAAGTVGRETVQYVSNIYKYYIAYKLTVERIQEKGAVKDHSVNESH